MNRSTSRRIWFLISLPILVAILLVISFFAWGHFGGSPIDVSQLKHKDHLIYQGDPQPDGSRDYWNAVELEFKRGVTADNNFAITVLETLSKKWSQVTEVQKAKFAVELNVESTSRIRLYSAKVLQTICKTEFDVGLYSRPINTDSITFDLELAALREMLEHQTPALDHILQELPVRPQYYYPFIRDDPGFHVVGGITHQTREIARWMRLRSDVRLIDRDLAASWNDVRGIFQMGNRVSQGFFYFEYLCSVFLQHMAIDQAVKLINDPNLEPELLREIKAELPVLLQMDSCTKAIDIGERANASQRMDNVIIAGKWHEFPGRQQGENLQQGWVKTSLVMDEINNLLDQLRDQSDSTDYANALNKADAAIEAVRIRNQLATSWVVSPTAEASKKAVQILFNSTIGQNPVRTNVRLIGKRRMLHLAIAIREFEFANKRLPNKMTELKDNIDPDVLLDPFTNDPWEWNVVDRNITLWGVGMNGIDDRPRRAVEPNLVIDDLEMTIKAD